MSKRKSTATGRKIDDSAADSEVPSQEILRQSLKRPLFSGAAHGAEPAHKKKKMKQQGKAEHKCKVCKKKFARQDSYYMHMKIHTDEQYACDECEFVTRCRKYLARHKKNRHTEVEMLPCSYCEKTFRTKEKVTKHERVHTGEKPYSCGECGKSFSARYSLSTHRLLHTDSKPFACAFCAYRCRDSSTLRKHQQRHLGVAPRYSCKQCGVTYKEKRSLKAHVMEKHLHIEQPKVECETCKQEFKNKTALNGHIKRVHERLFATRCEICGQEVSSRYNLAAHMRAHSTARPHPCTQAGCGKSFKSLSDMLRHRFTHFTWLHAECAHCGLRFSRRARLASHILKMHQTRRVKDTECELCGKKFYSARYLSKHLAGVHAAPRLRCAHCPFTTRMKPALAGHIKGRHASVKERTCSLCNKVFRLPSSRRAHQAMSHGQRKYDKELHKVKEEPETTTEGAVEGGEGAVVKVAVKEEPIDIEEHDVAAALAHAHEIHADINLQQLEAVSVAVPRSEEKQAPSEPSEQAPEPSEQARGASEQAPIALGTNFEDYVEVSKAIAPTEFYVTVGRKRRLDPNVNLKLKRKAELEIQQQLERARRKIVVDSLERARQLYNKRICARAEIEKRKKETDSKPKQQIRKLVLKRDSNTDNEYSIDRGSEQDTRSEKDTDINGENDEKTVADVGHKDSMRNGERRQGKTEGFKKIKFNTSQCYVCFKLYQTRDQLIEHCQEHFAICNKQVLNKCPLCPYVSPNNVYRHLTRAHGITLRTAYNTIIEKDSCKEKYAIKVIDMVCEKFDSTANSIEEISIIPSVMGLNKKASAAIDRENRKKKAEMTMKSKLVKKGDEWIVDHEKIDVNYEDYILPEFREKTIKRVKIGKVTDDYVEALMRLKIAAKKDGHKILAPCDLCNKVCLNISALKAHRKSHEVKQKGRKRKYVRAIKKVKKTNVVSKAARSNNTKPIRINNNKQGTNTSNEELMDFYKSNIDSADIDFDQFVKIFQQIDKVETGQFNVLVKNEKFGVEEPEPDGVKVKTRSNSRRQAVRSVAQAKRDFEMKRKLAKDQLRQKLNQKDT
ncbi:uncharacterized protein LOC105396324 [Plutella xylostella]|uniref:uncharacterized protein LOC105396324 n=1 Tax=Plutella xylostella TaxID=51655 RepID=UPI002032258F|nr:uncharacterized protein LOC105396324 [Plutella xylostella]